MGPKKPMRLADASVARYGTTSGRRFGCVLGAAILLSGSLTGCDRDATGEGGRASFDFPAPSPSAVATVSRADFVGAEACADCHEDQYGAWAASTHGRAGGTPGPEIVIERLPKSKP